MIRVLKPTVMDIRRVNRSTVLRRIYLDRSDSRQELSQLSGLSSATVTNVVAELLNEQGMLIRTVVTANPRTIVVLATGGPALMPWLEQVPTVLESWYGGQEMGYTVADVLFGDVTPS